MSRMLSTAVTLALLFHSFSAAAEVEKRTLVFEDSFERAQLGDRWLIPIKSFAIRNGILLGHEEPDRGHGAVVRTRVPFKNAVIDFSFRFVDGKSFNFVVNDKDCKSVHAGHICRVSISPTRVRIADDKEGVMKNEIFAIRKDPARRAEFQELVTQTERKED